MRAERNLTVNQTMKLLMTDQVQYMLAKWSIIGTLMCSHQWMFKYCIKVITMNEYNV